MSADEQPPLYNSGWTLSMVKAALGCGANLVDLGEDGFNDETRAWLKQERRAGRLVMVQDYRAPRPRRAFQDPLAFDRAAELASGFLPLMRVLTGNGGSHHA
jgi:hypothetical protein